MYTIREFQETDLPFLLSSLLSAELYGAKRNIIADSMLNISRGYVACAADDSNQILGIAIFSVDTLMWCYTKEIYRRLGIATTLCSGNNLKYFWLKGRHDTWKNLVKQLKLKWSPHATLANALN